MAKSFCKICKKEFYIPPRYIRIGRGFYCSSKCYGISKLGYTPWNKDKKTGLVPKTAFKKGHIPWHKGTRKKFIKTGGYIFVYKPDHLFCKKNGFYNGYILRSRLKMEKHLKRFLKPEEIVHHINKIRSDDRISNLILFINQTEHKRFHASRLRRYQQK